MFLKQIKVHCRSGSHQCEFTSLPHPPRLSKGGKNTQAQHQRRSGLTFEPRAIDPVVEQVFRELVAGQCEPIRQVCVHFWNFEPLDLQPDLFGEHPEFKRRELHHALEEIEARYGPRSIKTGTRLLAEKRAAHLLGEKAKCPFVPQREMEIKVGELPEALRENTLDPAYEEAWLPLEPGEGKSGDGELPLPRTWGRSTSRVVKFG